MTEKRRLTQEDMITLSAFKEVATAISVMDSSSHAEDMMIEIAEKQPYFPDSDSGEGWDSFIKGTLTAVKVMHLMSCLRVSELKHDIGAIDDDDYEHECGTYLGMMPSITKDMLRTCEVYSIDACAYLTEERKKHYMEKSDSNLNTILKGLADLLCDGDSGTDEEDEDEEPEVSVDAEGNEYKIVE